MKNSSNKKAKDRVCRVFSEVQAGNYLPLQAVAALQLVQEESGKSEGTAKGTKSFSSGMELGLKHCLNLYLTSDTSTAKDILMETFVEFALVSTGQKPPKQSVCCWPNHSYAVSVLKHILDNTTRSSDKGVRTRSCQMVAQLLKVSSYPEEYFAKEDEILRLVLLKMQERLKDKSGSVRAQALCALTRLQRPSEGAKDVIHGHFLNLLETDPDCSVRLAAMNAIAITPPAIEELVNRTRDVSEEVRKAAFATLSKKVDVFKYTPDQMASLIDVLLTKNPSCFEDCYRMVYDSWLVSVRGNVVRLLSLLDVKNHEAAAEALVHVLLQRSSGCRMACFTSQESEEEFSLSFTVTLCGPLQAIQAANASSPRRSFVFRALTPEFSLFWRVYCEHFYEPLGDLLQDALPELTFVCQLAEQHLKDPFMCKQIMRLLLSCDLYDEVGRAQLGEFLVQNIYELADDSDFVDSVMRNLQRLYPFDDKWLKIVIRILLTIKKPLDSEESGISSKMQARVWIKCLNIVSKALEMTKRGVKDPLIGPMFQTFILPTVAHPDPAVRIEGVRALGLFCLLDRAVAREYLFLFLKVLDNDSPDIRTVSLQALLDLIVAHGPRALCIESALGSEENDTKCITKEGRKKQSECDNGDGESDEEGKSEGSNALRAAVACLDDTELRALAAEGLAKCFYVGALRCPQVFGRLVALRCDPTLSGDGRLQKCLESFFHAYVSSKPFHARHQALVAKALVPALRWCACCNKERKKKHSTEIPFPRVVETIVQLSEFATQANSSVHDYEICVRVAKNFVDYVVEAPDQAARCAECVKLLKVPSVCKDPALLESLIHEIEAYLSSGRNDVCTVAKKLSKFLASLKALSVPNSIVQTKEKASGGDLRKSKVAKSNKPKSEDGEETEKEDEEEEGCKTDVGTEAEDESEMVIMKQALVERQRSYVPDESESLETCCDESNKEASCGESTTKKKSAVEVGKEDDENLAAPVPKRPKLAKSEKATKKEPMILFAGFTKFPELRAQLEKQVAELGGTVRGEDASVSTRVTHVVRPEGALSTRMLVAALFGAWVVGPKWVTDSSEKGEFLDEAMYGKRFMEETHPLRGRKVVMDESYKDDPKFDGIFDTLLIRDAGKAEIVEFVPGVKCDIALVAKNVSATALKDLAETGARIYTRSQFYKSLLP